MRSVYSSGFPEGRRINLFFTGRCREDVNRRSVTDLNLQLTEKFGCPGERKLSNNIPIPVHPLVNQHVNLLFTDEFPDKRHLSIPTNSYF